MRLAKEIASAANILRMGFMALCWLGLTNEVTWFAGEVAGCHCEAARVFHYRNNWLVTQADSLHSFVDIHQRHRVFRMLKIRVHVIRRSTGKSFDVRKIHDGFVKLHDRRGEQRNNPAIVVAGVASGARWSGMRVATAPLNVISYFSYGSMVRL